MRRGEVWRVRRPAVPGHTQAGTRPAVIVPEDQRTKRCLLGFPL
jgi:mRNA-degrading endonuclease toxin of MazEF toxin-antitoxin module